jgi:hypothetical protein
VKSFKKESGAHPPACESGSIARHLEIIRKKKAIDKRNLSSIAHHPFEDDSCAALSRRTLPYAA